MIIREIEKTHAPRKNKEINPLRKSAQELGFLLKGLSESVQSAKKQYNEDADSLETPHGSASRCFKLKSAMDDSQETSPLPFKLEFNDEQTQVLNLLKEARKAAADASVNGLAESERNALSERFQTVLQELNEKYPQTLASLKKEGDKTSDEQLSVSTHKSAADAFSNVEDMIVKIFELGAQWKDEDSDSQSSKIKKGKDTNNTELPSHKSALGACKQIRELFNAEGGAKTFGRFQEIDRLNVIGLLE